MKLRSRGLGRKELVMDFREYHVVREDKEIIIRGTIHEPVHWDFSITVCEDDLAGLVRIGTRRATVGLLLRSLFKRNKSNHWNTDRRERIEQAKERRKDNAEKIAKAATTTSPAEERARRRARTQAGESAGNGRQEGTADAAVETDLARRRRRSRRSPEVEETSEAPEPSAAAGG